MQLDPMIEIAAVPKSPAEMQGAADVSSAASGGADFLALLARTLSGQADGSPGKAVINLAGGGEPPAADHPAAGATSPQEETDTQAVDPAGLLLMQSLAVSGMASIPVQAAVQGTANSGQAAAVDVLGRKTGGGQNLPNRLAVLAGQMTAGRGRAQTEASQVDQSVDPDPGPQRGSAQVQPAMKFLDALPAKIGDLTQASTTQNAPQANPFHSMGAGPALSSPAAMPAQVSQYQADKSVLYVQNPFGTPGWTRELGDKVAWMASAQGHISQLVLNPPSLGTVEVRLHVSGNEAGAQFFSANADVRSAIEAAMPKLRDMLADAGIALGQTMVSSQSFGQRESFKQGARTPSQAGLAVAGVATVDGGGASSAAWSVRGIADSLLDYYA